MVVCGSRNRSYKKHTNNYNYTHRNRITGYKPLEADWQRASIVKHALSSWIQFDGGQVTVSQWVEEMPLIFYFVRVASCTMDWQTERCPCLKTVHPNPKPDAELNVPVDLINWKKIMKNFTRQQGIMAQWVKVGLLKKNMTTGPHHVMLQSKFCHRPKFLMTWSNRSDDDGGLKKKVGTLSSQHPTIDPQWGVSQMYRAN